MHSNSPTLQSRLVLHAFIPIKNLATDFIILNLNGYMEWILFNLGVLFFLLIDLLAHRKEKAITLKASLLWSIFWIALSFLFALYILVSRGEKSTFIFITGYFAEKALSIDNLFVFVLIFKFFKTPLSLERKALFWGILGAIVMRALFIFSGIAILEKFHAIIYLFGAFLIYMGIKFAFQKKEGHWKENRVVAYVEKHFPITDDYVGTHFFVSQRGKWMITPLFLVLIAIETTDIIFAIDSIPVILGITTDPFLAYTSNILAILGLRALYFVVQHILGLFKYLHYGLAAILIFIGVKMVASYFFETPLFVTFTVIFLSITLSILASFIFNKNNN